MKSKHVFSVLVIILVSGCIGGSQISSTSPVVQGDTGLDFTIQNVPDYIQSGSTFSFLLEIINYGGYSVPPENIKVNLANTNFFEYSQDTLTNDILLIKRTPDIERGGMAYLNFDNVLFSLPALAGDTTSLSLNTCYYYQTYGLVDICVSDDSYGDICNAVGEKEIYSSSAPVKISEFSQLNSLKVGSEIKSTIRFKIKKMGSETVSSKGANDFDCSGEDLNQNSVRINSIRIGNIEFNSDGQSSNTISQICGGNEIINLNDNGEATVTCNIVTYHGWTSALGEFEERLTINLDYVNNEIVSKELSIIG